MKKMKGYADGGIVEDDEEQPQEPNYDQELQNYFNTKKTAVDEFGPDQQKAVVDHITQSQHGLGNTLAKGAATFGDALMQGVARAGNPGFLKNIEDDQAHTLENAEAEGRSLNEQNLQGVKEKTALDSMSSNNPLGASRAAAMRPLLQQIYPTLQPQELDSILKNPSAAEAALGPAVNLKEAEAKIDALKNERELRHENLDRSFNENVQKHQDQLEQQGKAAVANLRGDKSLARVEEQRDAAIIAFNRLKEIRDSGKQLNPIDYTDILGQIYKARTGAAPTEQVLNEIRQNTVTGSLGKAYTMVTGNQAPATTQDIANSLMDMAKSMGVQADKFHEGYMRSHLIKPSGLSDEKWAPIVSTGRGTSFAEATAGGSNGSSEVSGPYGPEVQRNGKTYVWSKSDGKYHPK